MMVDLSRYYEECRDCEQQSILCTDHRIAALHECELLLDNTHYQEELKRRYADGELP